MRNFFIIAIVVIAMGYMFSILATKYETIKSTNETINKVNNK